ncbi:MAG TPA: DUF4397 domain-containing protein [Gemmatimonadales bacterium]|nr:DUF4397 domain-containing protein [Gemmatimonadales bacterium]
MRIRRKARTTAALATLLGAVACDRAPETGAVTSRRETGGTAAPSAEVAERTDRSLVRVINAIPGSTGISIYAGDSAAFRDVGFKKVTGFRQIERNATSFAIRGPDGKPVAENREVMSDGGHYTLIAMPGEGGADQRNLRVLNDDFLPIPGDKARIRFVNAIPGEDDLSLKLRGYDDELFSDVAFKREAGWKDVDPFVGTLLVLDRNDREVATVADIKIGGGKSHTLVAAGRKGGAAEIILVEDDVKPAVDE